MKKLIVFLRCIIILSPLPAAAATGFLDEAQKKSRLFSEQIYGAAAPRDLETVIGTIVATFLGLLGVVFLGLAIYGGYLWMTARGNEQMVEKAKETLKAAVIGIAIVLAGYAIADFVISALIRATTEQGAVPAKS